MTLTFTYLHYKIYSIIEVIERHVFTEAITNSKSNETKN